MSTSKQAVTSRRRAKYKVTRTLLCNLWGREKSPFVFRNYGPGQHGTKAKLRTPYGTQLRAKQMLRLYYNMTEKQFRNVFNKAHQKMGDTGANLLVMLETRLDAVVYHSNLAPTIFAARQLINHGHVTVNGKRVTIRSASVAEGDVISLNSKAKAMELTKGAILKQERKMPSYLVHPNSDDKSAVSVARMPVVAENPYPFEVQVNLVIELYSK